MWHADRPCREARTVVAHQSFFFSGARHPLAFEAAPSGWSPAGGSRRGLGDVRRSRLKLRSTRQRRRGRLRAGWAVRAWTLTWPRAPFVRCREEKRPSAAPGRHVRLGRAHAAHRMFRVRGGARSPVCTEADRPTDTGDGAEENARRIRSLRSAPSNPRRRSGWTDCVDV